MPIEPMGTRPDQGPRTETFRERYDEIRSRLTFGDLYAQSKQRADYNDLAAEMLDRIEQLEGEVEGERRDVAAWRLEVHRWRPEAIRLSKLLDEAAQCLQRENRGPFPLVDKARMRELLGRIEQERQQP